MKQIRPAGISLLTWCFWMVRASRVRSCQDQAASRLASPNLDIRGYRASLKLSTVVNLRFKCPHIKNRPGGRLFLNGAGERTWTFMGSLCVVLPVPICPFTNFRWEQKTLKVPKRTRYLLHFLLQHLLITSVDFSSNYTMLSSDRNRLSNYCKVNNLLFNITD